MIRAWEDYETGDMFVLVHQRAYLRHTLVDGRAVWTEFEKVVNGDKCCQQANPQVIPGEQVQQDSSADANTIDQQEELALNI